MKLNLYTLKFTLALTLLGKLLLPAAAQAQQLGIANSNYAGTNSLYANPSSIADARHSFYFNLFSTEFGATNNYLRYDGPVSLFKLLRNDMEFKSEYIRENLNGKPKLIMAGADIKGPSVMLQLSPKHSVAFSTRVRTGLQVNNLSEEIARLYKVTDGQDDAFLNKAYTNNTMNLNANAFAEFGLTYARVLVDQGEHFIKGGITVKKLSGGYSAHLNVQQADFKAEERFIPDTEDPEYVLKVDKIKAQYGYAALDNFDAMDAGDILGLLAGKNSPGKGWGADLGFTYEYRPDHLRKMVEHNGVMLPDAEAIKYKYRLGISLMDLGSINYNNPSSVWAYDIERNNKEVNLSELGDAEDTEEMLDYLNQQLDVAASEKKQDFRSALPGALHINFDYRIKGALYANATLIQGLRGQNAIGMRQNSLLALTPRAEFKKFEVAMPLALQNNYSVMTVGAMVRFLNFYIGSDNIGGLLNLGNPYGANAYVGVSLLPILQRNPKDKTAKAAAQPAGN